MPTSLQAALLGVVQGLTEFLPVSSSAHLILARAFFGFDGDKFGLAFDVACHAGTLVAVLIYFRREIGEMLLSLPHLLEPSRDANAYLIWLIVVGTIPAVVVGLLFKDLVEDHFRTPAVAAATLAGGALLLMAAERSGAADNVRSGAGNNVASGAGNGAPIMTLLDAFWIGCAQALALVPGVSRSGATITAALFLGVRRVDAASFIFLLSIPAIMGAAASEAPKMLAGGALGANASLFAIGIVSSAIVGYAAVKYFVQYLARHSLDVFAWYRLALAAAVVVWYWRT